MASRSDDMDEALTGEYEVQLDNTQNYLGFALTEDQEVYAVSRDSNFSALNQVNKFDRFMRFNRSTFTAVFVRPQVTKELATRAAEYLWSMKRRDGLTDFFKDEFRRHSDKLRVFDTSTKRFKLQLHDLKSTRKVIGTVGKTDEVRESAFVGNCTANLSIEEKRYIFLRGELRRLYMALNKRAVTEDTKKKCIRWIKKIRDGGDDDFKDIPVPEVTKPMLRQLFKLESVLTTVKHGNTKTIQGNIEDNPFYKARNDILTVFRRVLPISALSKAQTYSVYYSIYQGKKCPYLIQEYHQVLNNLRGVTGDEGSDFFSDKCLMTKKNSKQPDVIIRNLKHVVTIKRLNTQRKYRWAFFDVKDLFVKFQNGVVSEVLDPFQTILRVGDSVRGASGVEDLMQLIETRPDVIEFVPRSVERSVNRLDYDNFDWREDESVPSDTEEIEMDTGPPPDKGFDHLNLLL